MPTFYEIGLRVHFTFSSYVFCFLLLILSLLAVGLSLSLPLCPFLSPNLPLLVSWPLSLTHFFLFPNNSLNSWFQTMFHDSSSISEEERCSEKDDVHTHVWQVYFWHFFSSSRSGSQSRKCVDVGSGQGLLVVLSCLVLGVLCCFVLSCLVPASDSSVFI